MPAAQSTQDQKFDGIHFQLLTEHVLTWEGIGYELVRSLLGACFSKNLGQLKSKLLCRESCSVLSTVVLCSFGLFQFFS